MQLAIAAKITDSTAAAACWRDCRVSCFAGRGALSGVQGAYVFDDLRLTLGRTSLQGRVVFTPGEPRPRVTANLSGPLVDFSELPSARAKPGGTSPRLLPMSRRTFVSTGSCCLTDVRSVRCTARSDLRRAPLS